MKGKNKKYRKNGFNKDPNKKYIIRFRIYPGFLFRFLDKWLKKMSAKGWHVVHVGIIFFWFEKGEPMDKEYFTYGLSTQEGNYSIQLRYPFLDKTYGVKEKKSIINANKNKKTNVVEIDTERIDVKTNMGYKELVSDRNRLYLRYFVRNILVYIILIIVLVIFLVFL